MMAAVEKNNKDHRSIANSVVNALNEVKLMRDDILPKKSINDLWNAIEEWEKEDNEV